MKFHSLLLSFEENGGLALSRRLSRMEQRHGYVSSALDLGAADHCLRWLGATRGPGMARRKRRTTSRSGKKTARKARPAVKKLKGSKRVKTRLKRRRPAAKRTSPTTRRVTGRKRATKPATRKKAQKVDDARRHLMQAETALAAEELPSLTSNR